VEAERIADGVHRVLKGYVNAYAVESDEGLIVVDTGLPTRADRIAEAIRGMGRDMRDVHHILVTHHHLDHVGSLPVLAKMTGATVYCHEADAPVVRGERPPPGPNRARLTGRAIGPVVMRIGPDQPACRVDTELHDADTLPLAGGIRVIHTPGHTAGQTSFLLERGGGILIAGDAAGARGSSKVGPAIGALFGMFTEDIPEALRSFRKLAKLDFEVAVFGHGNPVHSGASELFRRNASRLPP
jgi:glyoxylase-like metal-dependent hydrolase (beta-lactamase superfamily II)